MSTTAASITISFNVPAIRIHRYWSNMTMTRREELNALHVLHSDRVQPILAL
ncbi:hypothetical protein TIFTF001_027449 [Ficus carica]|uniref:Uncharacterized protein n=1 Tax=Ficus carica TaxID=3494 RepID=A0AA88IV58_FICCA|nr:hypothetical protein TIFTF001_027449 [Ficus carica]